MESKYIKYIIYRADDDDEARLQTISGLLDEKLQLIKDLDSQVLDLCELAGGHALYRRLRRPTS